MKINNYSLNEKTLKFENGCLIEFKFPIRQSIVFNDMIIILLHIGGNTQYNRNIFAADFNGVLLWQIEQSNDLDLMGYCPFISLEMIDSELVSHNWCGFRYIINPSTGKIISKIFTK